MDGMKMIKLSKVVAAAMVGIALAGCKGFDPLDMEQTARDHEEYKSGVQIGGLPRTRIAVFNKLCVPEDHYPVFDGYIVNQMKGYIVNAFTGLGELDAVGQNGFTVDGESDVPTDGNGSNGVKTRGAQKLLIAETSINWYAGSRTTYFPDKADSIEMITNYRIVDLQSKETVLSTSIESKAEKMHGGNAAMQAIDEAAELNAKKFAKFVSVRILPCVEVIQMRGSGLAAQVSLGENYMAERGDIVEFLRIEDDRPLAFASGVVMMTDAKRSWVEVADYEKAGVKKGHFVKLRLSEKSAER